MKNHSSESNRGLVTCVRLSKETRDRLAGLGSKDQTFDDIVNVTIDKSLAKQRMCEDELAQKMSDESEEKPHE
ncbi:MAG: hypothetical protein IIA83_04705 [Thaumarchaeota archaeon]|nr:hypothetical protein [Nitrososphaerota archaeon]